MEHEEKVGNPSPSSHPRYLEEIKHIYSIHGAGNAVKTKKILNFHVDEKHEVASEGSSNDDFT